MKHAFNKILCLLLATIMCSSALYVSSYASEYSNAVTDVKCDESVDIFAASSATLLSEGGVLENTTKSFTINVPESTTYTFTIVVRPINGSDGLWTTFQKSGYTPILDRNINGSFQQRYELSSGTWYLRLTSAPGTCVYSVSIHRTF